MFQVDPLRQAASRYRFVVASIRSSIADLPVDVRRFDRDVVPARPLGGDLFGPAAGAARVDRLDDLAAAVAAAEHDAQAAAAGRRLLRRFPVDAESAGVAGEGLGLLVAAARPAADRLPDDDRLRGCRAAACSAAAAAERRSTSERTADGAFQFPAESAHHFARDLTAEAADDENTGRRRRRHPGGRRAGRRADLHERRRADPPEVVSELPSARARWRRCRC